MTKTIRWFGAAFITVGSVIFLSLLASAAPGDAVFIQCYPDCETQVILSAAEKTSLDACMKNLWADADEAQVDYFYCLADKNDAVKCDYHDTRTVTLRTFVNAEGGNKVLGTPTKSGGNMTYRHKNIAGPIVAAHYTCLKTWADGVFAGIDKDKMHEVSVKRADTRLLAQWEEHATASDATYTTMVRDKKRRRRTGTVE